MFLLLRFRLSTLPRLPASLVLGRVTSDVRTPEDRSLLTDLLLFDGRELGLVEVEGRVEGLEMSRLDDFLYPPLILDRLEDLGLVVDGRVCGLEDGRAAGRVVRAGCRDILAREARCPMRWASASRGVRKQTRRAAKVAFSNNAVEHFIIIGSKC